MRNSIVLNISFHRFKNVDLALKSNNHQIKSEDQVPHKIKVDQISTAGVAIAAIGSGIADLLINALIPEEKKSNKRRYCKINF